MWSSILRGSSLLAVTSLAVFVWSGPAGAAAPRPRGLKAAAQEAGSDESATARQPTSQEAVNKLAGVVVLKADGMPLRYVAVGLAHAKEGHLYLKSGQSGGSLEAYGGSPTTKGRNKEVSLSTRTDENGRFEFARFTSMTDEYTLVVVSRKRGVALLRKLVPKDYQDKPLRIELEPPAYVHVAVPKHLVPSGFDHYVALALEPDVVRTEADGKPVYAEEGYNLSITSSETGTGSRRAEFGPLPGGVNYRLKVAIYKEKMPYQPTVREQLVSPKAGETLTVLGEEPSGATLSGRITGKDGTPLKDVNVRVAFGPQQDAVYGALTGQDGRYKIEYLPAGKYRVELERRRVRTAPG